MASLRSFTGGFAFKRLSSGNIGIQRPLKEQLLVGWEWCWLRELLIPGQVDAVQLQQFLPIPNVKREHPKR